MDELQTPSQSTSQSPSPAAPSVPVQILCRQCSAPLPVEEGSTYVQCEFCGTTNVVEKGQTVFHYAVLATVDEAGATAELKRWMAGNETIKGLDQAAQIQRPAFEYFPMWLVRRRRDGQETLYLQPAAALSVSELKRLTVPAGDLTPYDEAMAESAVTASVPYLTMLSWLKEQHGVVPAEIHGVALVHVPIFRFTYLYKDRRYSAVVDAAAGQVFCNIFPAKWEVPYRALGAVAFVAYLLAAFIPLAGFSIGEGAGLAVAILIYLVAVVVLAIPLFSAAAAVSKKV
jgi:LSD1 subclass zinc finger protein